MFDRVARPRGRAPPRAVSVGLSGLLQLCAGGGRGCLYLGRASWGRVGSKRRKRHNAAPAFPPIGACMPARGAKQHASAASGTMHAALPLFARWHAVTRVPCLPRSDWRKRPFPARISHGPRPPQKAAPPAPLGCAVIGL